MHICIRNKRMMNQYNWDDVIPFRAENTEFSPKNVLIVAELGTSHGGDRKKAKEKRRKN